MNNENINYSFNIFFFIHVIYLKLIRKIIEKFMNICLSVETLYIFNIGITEDDANYQCLDNLF